MNDLSNRFSEPTKSERLLIELRAARDAADDQSTANLLRRAVIRIERLERLAKRMLE